VSLCHCLSNSLCLCVCLSFAVMFAALCRLSLSPLI
jgi:hypothetical protein